MEPNVPGGDDTVRPIGCPVNMLKDTFDTFAETGRLLSGGVAPEVLPASIGRTLSSVIEANGVFFEQLATLAARFQPDRTTAAHREQSAGATSATAPADTPGPAGPATVLLRAAPGTEAVAAFALRNLLPKATTATVLPTAFVNPAGDQVPVALRLEPGRVTLVPGEEIVVKVMVDVPADLPADQPLQGAIHVPGMTTSMVPVIIRAG
ncbi:MAG TPA: hypothetical protein VJT49_13960 [Amycolatopsis sp.]|uniref:hypothetical protein n=1 Tax=Amycolatopsis sp. TaxID=37632 RepID=UPI002B4847EF|nr:hypothetical protein [Amycolatopsis sp.]HKS46188.1 hypothetical protein [Amycolatopsis sp.]